MEIINIVRAVFMSNVLNKTRNNTSKEIGFATTLFFLSPLILGGCSSLPWKANPLAFKYRGSMIITEQPETFFSWRNIPDSIPRTITNLAPATMRAYEIELNDLDSTAVYSQSRRNEIEDLLFLAAAEVANHSDFSKFIAFGLKTDSACGSVPTASTYGNAYSSTTYLYDSGTCIGYAKVKVILFNNYADVSSGVYSSKRGDGILPKPAAYAEYYSPEVRPWKPTYYDAKEVAQKIREKYKIADNNIYPNLRIIEFKEPKKAVVDSLKKSQ